MAGAAVAAGVGAEASGKGSSNSWQTTIAKAKKEVEQRHMAVYCTPKIRQADQLDQPTQASRGSRSGNHLNKSQCHVM